MAFRLRMLNDENWYKMKDNVFFIVGVQRSGTTLLQTLMSKHPKIAMEPRSIAFRIISCFKNVYDLFYPNLAVDKTAFLKWLILNDDKGRLAELIDHQHLQQYGSIQELVTQSISKKIQQENKVIWGDKSPNLQHYISDLLLLIPHAKIIHIVRDGRANAYSMSLRSYRHLKLSAQQWVDGNIYGLVNESMIGKENYKIIKYEELLSQPEIALQSVCDFLQIPYAQEMLDLSNKRLAADKSYVKSFFDRSKIDKWKTQLSTQEIKQIELIQGPLLQKLGYELLQTSEATKFKALPLRRRILYNQLDNVKQLFRRKTIGMKNQEIVELRHSLKSRINKFFKVIAQDFLPLPIFKALFNRQLYKKKKHLRQHQESIHK